MSSTILQPLQGWVRLVSHPTPDALATTAYCLLPTAYCLRGWAGLVPFIYNSSTPTGLGHVSTCRLQFFNPYRVGSCIHMSSTILQPLQGWARLVSLPTPDALAKHYCLLPAAYCLRGWAGLVPIIYNSSTPTGLGHVSTCRLQFFNPYRVGSDWFPIQRLMPSPLLPTAYGVGLVWCRSSTILQPLQGWVMYPHVVYNSSTPTGLGHVSTCRLQFFNPYRVGSCIHMSSTILQPLQGWVMYPHVVYNSATPTGLGQVGFPSDV